MSINTPHKPLTGNRADGLLKALSDRLTSGEFDDVLDTDVDVNELADRMMAAVPARLHETDDLLGPFFDSATLGTWRHVSRQAIQKATHRRDIIGMKIGDGSFIYPSFQFGTRGELLPRLREVLGLLDPDLIDPWGSALWLNTVDPAFGETDTNVDQATTAAMALRDGRGDSVISEARKAHRSWIS